MSLKKHLETLSKEELIKQILELNQKYKDVKTYYSYFVNPLDKEVAKNFKKIIRNEFFPLRGGYGDPKLSVARKAVNDFKKLSPPPEELADLMIYYVENGVEFTNAYGDINEPFYNSVAGMYRDACKLIKSNSLKNIFKTRCEKIVNETEDIGWGFHDELSDYYYEFIES